MKCIELSLRSRLLNDALLNQPINIIGGGLAGCEAAWQLAERGFSVVLTEMRPVRTTDAHQTDRLAELVCSNSLKSDVEPSASWLLKEELRRLGSLLMAIAGENESSRRTGPDRRSCRICRGSDSRH